MTTTPVDDFAAHVERFKPKHGLAATNSNDLRRFVYDWFTHFEHAAPIGFYRHHLADTGLDVRFPGVEPITNHVAFTEWYENLIANTLWNFHDLSAIQIKQLAAHDYLVTFVVDWYGEVRPDSDQLAGWQSRTDSYLYHYFIRQTWTITEGDRLLIQTLVATDGNSPSPITE